MQKTIIFAILLLFGCHRIAQDNSGPYTEPPELVVARQELEPFIQNFNNCLLQNDLDLCIAALIDTSNTNTGWKQFVIAEKLFSIAPKLSFHFHEAAFRNIQNDPFVKLWYAIELHRKGDFQKAAEYYEQVKDVLTYHGLIAENGNVIATALLADCHINTGKPKQALKEWNSVDTPFARGLVATAICFVYRPADRVSRRSDYRKDIQSGDVSKAFDFLYNDIHWEDVPWGYGEVQTTFLQEDLMLLRRHKSTIPDLESLEAYALIIKYMKLLADKTYVDSVKIVLEKQKWIVNDSPLPDNASIAADLLNICFTENIIPVDDFAGRRKSELVNLATLQKNAKLLKVYTNWVEMDPKKTDIEISRLGWKVCMDEQFALRYLRIKGNGKLVVYDETLLDVAGLSYNDTDLEQALRDFPNAARIHWIKVNCAFHEKLPMTTDIIETIKHGFNFRNDDAYCADETRSLGRYFRYLYNDIEHLRQTGE